MCIQELITHIIRIAVSLLSLSVHKYRSFHLLKVLSGLSIPYDGMLYEQHVCEFPGARAFLL